MKRKDVQRLALELVDAIDAMRTEMAAQDAVVQWQAAVIDELRAAGDALAAVWPEGDVCQCDGSDCVAVRDAIAGWREVGE